MRGTTIRGTAGWIGLVIVGSAALSLPSTGWGQGAAGHAEYVGAETCLACHEGTDAMRHTLHTQRAFMQKGITEEQSCETCHGAGSLHAEAGGERTAPGFDRIWGPTTDARSLGEACWTCHESSHPLFKSTVHAQRGYTCTACHTTHAAVKPGTDQGFLLKKGSINETCFDCHRDKKAHVSRVAHMPVREGKVTCADCHDPHGTPHARNLTFATVNDLCVSCHEEKRGPFLWEHAPVRDNCMNCHDPHGSLHDKMVVAKRPFLLCQTCHVGTRHPSTLYDDNAVQSESNRVINRSCQNCHSMVHGSNHPSGKFFLR